MLNFPKEFILPNYNSAATIANIAPTVASLFDVPFQGLPPFSEDIWQGLKGDINRVVLILIDALGKNILGAASPAILKRVCANTTLTSVFPSTTASCLPTAWTGFSPAQHGLVGLRLFLPELSLIGQMISFSPDRYDLANTLVRDKIDIETYLPVPTMAEQIMGAGIRTTAITHRRFVNSSFSKLHGRGVKETLGVSTFAEMMIRVNELLTAYPNEKQLIYSYWDTVDTLSHTYSPFSQCVFAEIDSLFYQLETHLLNGLSSSVRKGTLVLVFSDHGQVAVSSDRQVVIEDIPGLEEKLFMRMTGSPRAPYLYVKHGETDEVINLINRHVGNKAYALRSMDALNSGLLGNEPYAQCTLERLGDVMVLPKENYIMIHRSARAEADTIGGRHGGLSPNEMLVPLLAFQLDS